MTCEAGQRKQPRKARIYTEDILVFEFRVSRIFRGSISISGLRQTESDLLDSRLVLGWLSRIVTRCR